METIKRIRTEDPIQIEVGPSIKNNEVLEIRFFRINDEFMSFQMGKNVSRSLVGAIEET